MLGDERRGGRRHDVPKREERRGSLPRGSHDGGGGLFQDPAPRRPVTVAAPPAPKTPVETKKKGVGFFRAMGAPWKGLWFVMRTPAAWPFAMVPLLVGTLIVVGLSSLGLGLLVPKMGEIVPSGTSWWHTPLRVFVQILAALGVLVLALLSGSLLAQPVSGPALERIVRLRERELGLPARPATSFWTDMGRNLRGAAIGLVGVAIVAALTIVDFAIPGSTIVVLPIKILVSAFFVSWDLLDYPLSVRNQGMRERLRWIGAHVPEVMGFGLSLAVVFIVPCMQLLLLPGAVAGATALLAAVDDAEADAP